MVYRKFLIRSEIMGIKNCVAIVHSNAGLSERTERIWPEKFIELLENM